jgi:hypothetical protein
MDQRRFEDFCQRYEIGQSHRWFVAGLCLGGLILGSEQCRTEVSAGNDSAGQKTQRNRQARSDLMLILNFVFHRSTGLSSDASSKCFAPQKQTLNPKNISRRTAGFSAP